LQLLGDITQVPFERIEVGTGRDVGVALVAGQEAVIEAVAQRLIGLLLALQGDGDDLAAVVG